MPETNDTSPVAPVNREKELVFLVDRSGSMTWPAKEGDNVQRKDVLGEAMGVIIAKLEDLDSQKSKEQAGGDTDKGGALTFTFANTAEELGDLNTDNWKQKWATIRWGGTTSIMPAYNLAIEDFMDEFKNTPAIDLPSHILVVFTDGEADDAREFETVMNQTQGAKTPRYVIVCTLGYGQDHDTIVKEYSAIAASNNHVRVLQFGGTTSPDQIASDVLATIGAA